MNKAELVKMLIDEARRHEIEVYPNVSRTFRSAAGIVEQALEGYAIVPVEPTEAMKEAGKGECMSDFARYDVEPIYKAMLTAWNTRQGDKSND